MVVFALHQGRLVAAAQSVPSEASPEILDAVRSQIFDFIGQPLFGVGWADQTFLALDTTGQVVSVDVVEALSAQDFSAALTRAGRHAQMSRAALGQMYPGGLESFDADYRAFVDSAPPRTAPGPRLHIFSLAYDTDVLCPILALRGGGVEAHRVLAYQSAQGLLVEIAELAELPAALPWAGEAVEPELVAEESATEEVVEGAPAEDVPAEVVNAAEPAAEEPAADVAEPAEDVAEAVEVAEAADVAEPEVTAEPSPEAEEIVDRAQRYDDAWDISGWRFEKERPAKRSASEVMSTVESRRTSRESRRALSEEARDLLEKNRQDVGPTMYDQLMSEAKRPEQRLWDMSAPKDHGATIYSEQASSVASQEAVTRAAMRPWESLAPAKPAPAGSPAPGPQRADSSDRAAAPDSATQLAANTREPNIDSTDLPEPLPRMQQVVAEVGAVDVTWRSRRRRRRSLSARLTETGLLEVEGKGVFADPSQAAVAASGMIGADGWRMWLVPDGRSFGEIA